MAKTGSVAVQMKELLDEINKDVQESAEKNVNLVARECVQKLKNTSPVKTGSYARGWAVKREGTLSAIVHNRTDYQLTHLLENGHVIRNKKGTYGRAPGIKHIAPVEDWAIDELPRRIIEDIP
jgi:pyruvate dehydrogenase complex dehydrogenase (E1) component